MVGDCARPDRLPAHLGPSGVMNRFLPVLIAGIPFVAWAQERQVDAGEAQVISQPEFLERLAALANSAPPVEPRRGDRAITGRVVDPRGKPLGGVLIRATRQGEQRWYDDRQAFPDDPPPGRDLAESLRRSAQWWYATNAEVHGTTSDADGRFAFTDLLEGRFGMEAWLAGFSLEAIGGSYGRIQVDTGSEVVFVGTPSRLLPVDLRFRDGSTPVSARLTLKRFGDHSGERWQVWSSSNRSVRLPAGDWEITARIHDPDSNNLTSHLAWFASRPACVAIDPERETEQVTIELRGVPAIEGRISTPARWRGDDLVVSVIALPPGEEADSARLVDERIRRDLFRSDASVDWTDAKHGTYRIHSIEPGRWLIGLVAGRTRRVLLTSAVVEVGEGRAVQDFELPAHAAGEVLRVRVLDPDGVPVPDCEFESSVTTELPHGGIHHSGYDWHYGERREGGWWELPHADRLRGRVLFARNPRFGTRGIEVPDDASELDIRFLPPVSTTLRLADSAENASGRRIEVELRIEDFAEPWRAPRPVKFGPESTGADGSIELGSLQPGRYRVRLFVAAAPHGNRKALDVGAASTEIVPGAGEWVVPFPPLGDVRISVPAGTKRWFKLTPLSRGHVDDDSVRRLAEVDADGTATFRDVPRGPCEISDHEREFMFIDAPVDGVIPFVAAPVNVLRVVIEDERGALAAAGLKTGDWLVALDGNEFSGRDHLENIRLGLRAPEVTVTVERAGERFEIMLPRELLQGSSEAGGRLVHSSRGW